MRSSVKLRETTIGAAVVAALASGACGSADRVNVEVDETPEAAFAPETIGVPFAEAGRRGVMSGRDRKASSRTHEGAKQCCNGSMCG